MTTFRLERHENQGILDDLVWHQESCVACQKATRIQGACQTARQYHELLVHEAQRRRASFLRQRAAGEIPWYQTIDLKDLPSEKAAVDYFREAAQARLATLTTLEGIDVSNFQGAFPWSEAVSAGVIWGIAKATEGNGYTDPQWGANVAWLLGQTTIVGGSYHFLRTDLGNAPADEANWYLGQHPTACFNPTVPWVFSLDAECNDSSNTACYEFLSTVSNYTGYSCWFYSFQNWIQTRNVQAFGNPLWLAWPDANGTLPNEGWPVVTAQQYGTRSFSVGAVDADRFLGDTSTLLVLAGVGDTSKGISRGTGAREDNMIRFNYNGFIHRIWVSTDGSVRWQAISGGSGGVLGQQSPAGALGTTPTGLTAVPQTLAVCDDAYQGTARLSVEVQWSDGVVRQCVVVAGPPWTVVQDWSGGSVYTNPAQLVPATSPDEVLRQALHTALPT